MSIEVSIATPEEAESLWRLNHEVYCEELQQHSADASGLRVDRLHSDATYFVAKLDGEVVGMLSVTPPGVGAISTLGRMPFNAEVHGHVSVTTEVRLLAVDRRHRGKGIYDRLIFSLMNYCSEKQIHRILISAVTQQAKLYELMGFRPIAAPVLENGCELQPMLLLRADFEASRYRRRTLARMEAQASA